MQSIAVGILLGIAVTLCVLCSVGMAVMRDSYQRLHFSSPVTSVGVLLITAAVWIGDSQWQARIKATVVAILLFTMNAVLGHATARAVRIRQKKHWAPTPDERIPVVKDRGVAGVPPYAAVGAVDAVGAVNAAGPEELPA